jgi:threonine dehydrogenase-like Zn-dependent dehydrogenase
LAKPQLLRRVARAALRPTDTRSPWAAQAFFEYPRVIGHELCVTCLEIPDGALNPQNVKCGDVCSVEPYLHCGSCVACKHGKTNCCMNIKVMGVHVDGGLRETFYVPVHKLHPVDLEKMPGGKPSVALVETLCIGCHAVNRAAVQPDEWVLIVGAGPVGMATSQFALADGGKVIAMDIVQGRLDFLKDEINVQHTVCITPGDPPEKTIEAITAITGGDLPTCVMEVTGNIHSMKGSFQYVSHGGRLVFVGHTKLEVAYNNPLFHSREMTVMGSRNARAEDFTKCIACMQDGKVNPLPWITHKGPLETFAERDGDVEKGDFMVWMKPETGVIKAVVEMPE